jgi:hypothetical protein
MLIFCLTYSSTLDTEATWSPETSADFERTEQCCILEDGALYNHRGEDLKSRTEFLFMYRL